LTDWITTRQARVKTALADSVAVQEKSGHGMPGTDRPAWHLSCSLQKSINSIDKSPVCEKNPKFHSSKRAIVLIRQGGNLMKPSETELLKPSFWQLVFSQSKVNGAAYIGEELPGRNWQWPRDTYFQRRLRRVRLHQTAEKTRLNYSY
jgi:hypothetical protein